MTRRGLRRFIGRKVVAHTFDDRSIQGVLAKVHRDIAVLDAPRVLSEAPDEALPAQIALDHGSVSFWQVGL